MVGAVWLLWSKETSYMETLYYPTSHIPMVFLPKSLTFSSYSSNHGFWLGLIDFCIMKIILIVLSYIYSGRVFNSKPNKIMRIIIKLEGIALLITKLPRGNYLLAKSIPLQKKGGNRPSKCHLHHLERWCKLFRTGVTFLFLTYGFLS